MWNYYYVTYSLKSKDERYTRYVLETSIEDVQKYINNVHDDDCLIETWEILP